MSPLSGTPGAAPARAPYGDGVRGRSPRGMEVDR